MPQAIVFPEPRRVELHEVELPTLAEGEVRLRTRVSLLSTGTEGIMYGRNFDAGTHWDRWFGYPTRPGYSLVGDVEESRSELLRPGDRVVVQRPHASHHVVDAARCTRVPDDVSDEDAAWFALAKVAFVGAEASGLGLGGRALVVGAGPVGQMAVRWLAAAGAAEITVVDRSGGPRLELAASGGATHPVKGDVADFDPDNQERVRPDVVIDSTGNAEAFAQSLRVVADRGRVVVLGDTGFPSEQRLTSDLIVRGITVVGAHGNHVRGERDHEVRKLFFRMVATRRFVMDGLVTHRFAPRACDEAYDMIETQRDTTMGIVFDWRNP
ncbi:MAG TPA: zinc-binding dehydrogenase [Actinopolymorphaceae bacterium]